MKTWLITGCSTGIGRGIAKAVLQSGDQAVVTARDVSTLRAFAEKYPDTCLTLPLDLTDWTSMDTAVRKAVARFGRIDVLVNNAGYGCRAAIEESEDGEIARLFETNLFGPVKLINLCLPQMRENRRGVIINVSSIGAVRAAVGNGFYSASKASLELVSDALAKEAAHLGIKVITVEPGAFRTAFYGSLHGTERKLADYDESSRGTRTRQGSFWSGSFRRVSIPTACLWAATRSESFVKSWSGDWKKSKPGKHTVFRQMYDRRKP